MRHFIYPHRRQLPPEKLSRMARLVGYYVDVKSERWELDTDTGAMKLISYQCVDNNPNGRTFYEISPDGKKVLGSMPYDFAVFGLH